MAHDDVTLGSASALSRAIHAREITCVEVMRRHLQRIERLNPSFNAIVSPRPASRLIEEAQERDDMLSRGQSLGWMHGFPIAPKDLSDAAGIPTTRGSRAWTGHVAVRDSVIVERMRAAGAIVIGKTNTPEFGLGSHTFNEVFGATRNAWDPKVSAGGSSGGAAVALALRMLPVADGSDMMGSLRNPAAWNGVYGLRPTPGRVPTWPALDVFYQQLGTDGPMARTAEDLAALLRVLAGHHPQAALSLREDLTQFAWPLAATLPRRVGWLGDLGGYLPIEEPVLRASRRALDDIARAGFDVREAAPFFDMERVWRAWIDLRSFLVGGALAALMADKEKRELLKPEARWEAERGAAMSALDVHRASCTRTSWHAAVLAALDEYEVLVLPSAQTMPFPVEERWPGTVAGRRMDTYHRWMEVTVPGSLAAVPVVNIPAGFDEAGHPLGLQLIAAPGREAMLLNLAQALESSTPWTLAQPPALSGTVF